MAKITLDLNSFKASGVYTVEFDTSERIVLSTETVRLVVGFSRKGPFNAPVFLRDLRTARQIFGNIDTFLEKRGSFFHRAIETCLQTGPIFALNLLPLNNVPINEGGDAVEYKSFSVDTTGENGPVSKDLVTSFYNKERFWFPDTENFIAITNNNPLNKGRLFNLVNLGQTPMSFIVRKPNPKVPGYNITAREYYGSSNVPDFVYEFDFMEDYFVEIIMIEGDWTDYKRLAEDPVYSSFFDERGAKVDRLNEFLALTETTVLGSFVGSIIPDFVDGNGSNQFIEILVNNAVASTGVFLSINREALDDYANSTYKVDMIGHNLIGTSDDTMNFLSYNTPISKAIAFDNLDINDQGDTPTFEVTDFAAGTYDLGYVISSPIGGNSGKFGNVLVVPKPAPTQTVFTTAKYQELLDSLSNISLIKTNSSTLGQDYVKVDQVIDNGSEFRVVLSNPEVENASYITETTTSLIVGGGTNEITVPEGDALSTGGGNGIILVEAPGFKHYFEVDSVSSPGGGAPDVISISTTPTAIKMAHSPFEYVAGQEELDEIVTALTNATIDYSDITITQWEDYDANSDLVPNLLTAVGGADGFSVVLEPASVFVHTDDNSAGDNTNEDYIEAYPGSKIAKDIQNARFIDGDLIYSAANAFNYVDVDDAWGRDFDVTSNLLYGLVGVRFRQYSDDALTQQIVGKNNDFVSGETGAETFEVDALAYGDGNDILVYSSAIEDLQTQVDIVAGSLNGSNTLFRIAESDAAKIEIGYFLVNSEGTFLTRVTGKRKTVNPSTGDVEFEISVPSAIRVVSDEVTVFTPINNFVDRLHFTYLEGFKLNEFHLPRNQEQAKKIYGVIEDTNLADTLASKDIITFRYIIDTMRFGIDPMMGPKAVLSRLAKKRQKCMAILNAPSIKEFMESTDPRFTDDPQPLSGNPRPLLKTEYIASGGNLSIGPSFRFTLPDEENGAKYMGVFSPFLTYRDNNKNISVPPAADVSNNFIRKFLNGQPYSIVAGPRRGILSNPKLVGLEYEYTLQDREFLEPFGINPIVTTRNVGIMIFGNQTAFQRTLSAFNNLHVRDLLITVENAIEDVLIQYLYEFNDATTRLEIKSIVENYLEGVRNAGGIFDYDVIMDETNNTPATIDQNFGIIDVGIEPARGMQKFVNRITVLKTGAISSGGFTIA